jgi:hypothetical protein
LTMMRRHTTAIEDPVVGRHWGLEIMMGPQIKY